MTFKAGVIAGLVLVLGVVNAMIAQKERVLREGELVLLPLRPVDPRSLLQGDYMDLRYDLGKVEKNLDEGSASDGLLVVRLDSDRVGEAQRIDAGGPLGQGEVRIRFRRRGSRLKIGAEAFHFQEGQASIYQRAGYGELRVSAQGEAVLVGLRGKDKAPLGEGR